MEVYSGAIEDFNWRTCEKFFRFIRFGITRGWGRHYPLKNKALDSKGGKMLSNRDRNLPEDVVNEILSRLPVKSLLRFKCVCKYAIAFFLNETLVGIPPLLENFDHLQIPDPMRHVVGPIDDIFLVYTYGYSDGNRMALWNPAMREFRLFHVLEPIFPPNFHVVVNVVGFGLDPLTRDYKIIWIRNFVERIGDVSGDDIDYPCYVVALYTLGDDSRYEILLFDMRLEEFREIKVPAKPEQKLGSLSLYNDSIGLFFCQTYAILECSIDIWVMEEEGCWNKLVTIKPFPEVLRPCGF
ncbi:uncharacterized protein LOC114284500 [Camellia sinensis]|uniref:uncharacterized protein LOC114284500 n=1 Tax=Camellia sinensis TaxID=4442 RepID=UPI00103621CE|nr:uncharacterized protein LOC114284500 [Camellia sinensis]